ncbi:MAG: GspH/FimT family pseudopilin [Syntrophobacterales bacterium]|nr:GspH/FimT family pseudopilin [Syntrophobacterales bacterium]
MIAVTQKKAGFTLVELVIVVALIGIVIGIAAPALQEYSIDVNLKSAARNLKSNMELSKLRAIRENSRVVMDFDTGNNSYEAFVDNGAGGGTAGNNARDGSEPVVKTVSIPTNVTIYEAGFPGGVPRFRFDGRGLPNGLGGHVYIKNTNDNYRGVALSMVGHIQIQTSTDGETWEDVD